VTRGEILHADQGVGRLGAGRTTKKSAGEERDVGSEEIYAVDTGEEVTEIKQKLEKNSGNVD